MKKDDRIKRRVLDAANARFEHYGFRKTTMAEIAADCAMTAGNLYRYFPGKEEIVTGIAVRWFQEREALLRKTVERAKIPASLLLEKFVLKNLEFSHSRFSRQKHLYELIEFITGRRREILNAHLKALESLAGEIIKAGDRTGEFQVRDIQTASEAVLSATVKFYAPHFMILFPLRDLRRMAREVARLLVKGLEGIAS